MGVDVDRATLLAQLQHLISFQSSPLPDGGIDWAINGLGKDENNLPEFAKDTFDYEQRFWYSGIRLNDRMRKSLRLIRESDFLDNQDSEA